MCVLLKIESEKKRRKIWNFIWKKKWKLNAKIFPSHYLLFFPPSEKLSFLFLLSLLLTSWHHREKVNKCVGVKKKENSFLPSHVKKKNLSENSFLLYKKKNTKNFFLIFFSQTHKKPSSYIFFWKGKRYGRKWDENEVSSFTLGRSIFISSHLENMTFYIKKRGKCKKMCENFI